MKRSIIFASMAIASGIVLTNIYTSVVDLPSWKHNVPASINTARDYFSVTNPGNFFRIFSPLNQFLGLAALLLFWKRNARVRWLLLAAFVFYITGEGLTFMYFYPRNELLFLSGTTDVAAMQNALQEWGSMNWLRTAVVVCGVVCSASALHYVYVGAPAQRNLLHQRRSVEHVTTA